MSNGDIVSVQVENHRLLSGAGRQVDGNPLRGPRGDNYGDIFTLPCLNPAQAAAMSGGYFIGNNATPQTELATHANQTAYDQNLPVALWRNTSTERVMIPDILAIKAETVGASADELLFVLAASATDDYSSAGTELTARNALIGYTGNPAHGKFYFGDPNVTDVAKIILANGMISDVVPVIDSNFIFRFGMPAESSYISGAATASHTVRNLPAVALAPGATCSLYIFGNALSATPTFDVFASWYER
jgi:hypothetical protein